jgi:hypothetical protein
MYADETYLIQEPSSMSDWEFGFSHLKLQQDLENHFTRLALSSDPNGVPSANSSSLDSRVARKITKTVVAHI